MKRAKHRAAAAPAVAPAQVSPEAERVRQEIAGQFAELDQMMARTSKLGLVHDDAAALGRALLSPMLTDPHAAMRALRGKSPAEIAALRESFHAQTGRDLDGAVGMLRGEELDVARYLLRGAPAAAPERTPGAVKKEDAATTVFQALDTVVDDDEDAVFRALAHRTPEEIAEIERSYRDHYGGDMRARIEEKLGGRDLERARALLAGDGGKAAALFLAERAPVLFRGEKPAWMPGAADGAELLGVIRDLRSDEERASLIAAYEEETGRDVTDLLKGKDGEQARALLAGDRARADAIRLEAAALDADEVAAVLRGAGPAEERRRLAEAYRARTGRPLEGDLRRELGGTDRDEALALLGGDGAGAAAARLQDDPARVFATFAGKPAAERQAIAARWEQVYGKGRRFDALLDGELDGMELERARQLVERGRVDTVLEARDAMERAGTLEGRLKGAFAGLDRGEVVDAEHRYAAAFDERLVERVEGETSGGDEFDVKQAMKGRPRSLDEAAARAAEAWDFERGSGRGLLGGVTDSLYDAGPVLDRQHLRADTLREMAQEAGTAEERKRIEGDLARVLDYHADDVEGYRSAEERVGSAAQMAAETAVAMGVTAATGGMGGNFAMARLAAQAARLMRIAPGALSLGAGTLVGGGAGMAARRLIAGESYGSEDLAIDGAVTLANTATAGIGAGRLANQLLPGMVARATGRAGVESAALRGVLDNPLVQSALVHGVQNGATGMVDGVVAAATDEQAWDEGDAASMLATVLRHTVAGTVTGGITGPLDEALRAPSRPRQRVARAALAGAAGGAISSGVQAAFDPATYAQDGDGAELRLLTGMSIAGLQGALAQGARARTKATLQPELARLPDVAGVERPPALAADLVTPGLAPEEIVRRLKARQETIAEPLLGAIDEALGDPGERADLRRRYRPQLQAELGAEVAAEVQQRLLRERPDLADPKKKAELEKAKRAAVAKQAAARLRRLSPDEIDERLRARLEQEIHAEAAAVTASELREQLDARSARTAESVFEGAAPLMVDFLVVGRGEPAAASYALEQKRTRGQGLVIADGSSLMGGRTGSVSYGQENQNVRVPGLVVQPDEVGLAPSPGRYGTTGELALASEATLAHAGAEVLAARVVGIEERPARPDATWPDDAMVRATVEQWVPVTAPDGSVSHVKRTAIVYAKQTSTLATGMGPPRRPSASDVGAEEGASPVTIGAGPDVNVTAAEDVLSSLPSFRDEDGKLRIPEKILEHGVVVQGGGASGSWAAEELGKLGIGASYMGRESPPEPGPLRAYERDPEIGDIVRQLGELNKAYRDNAAVAVKRAKQASKRGETRGDYLAGGGEEARDEMVRCLREGRELNEDAMDRLREMREDEHRAMLASGNDAKARQLHWRKLLALEQTLEGIGNKLDTHEGLQMDRNAGTAASPYVDLGTGDVLYSETTRDGLMRLYLHDGRIVETAQLLTATGQMQGAATKLMPNAKLRSVKNPMSDEVYGVETPTGRTRLAGAAAAFGFDARAFADESDYAETMEFWRAASIAHGDPDSRGVSPGLRTAVGDRVLGMLVVAKYRELLPQHRARNRDETKATEDALRAAKGFYGIALDDFSGLRSAP